MNIRRGLRLESESERFREIERKVGEKKKRGGGYREGECKRDRVRFGACVAERQTDRQTF